MIVLIARSLLAAVFAVAAIAKLADRRGTRETLVEFGLPDRLAGSGAIALPALELAIAVLLLPMATARWAGLAAAIILLTFCIAIGRSLAQGKRPDCNCFGPLRSAPIGPGSLVRNLLLASVGAVVAVAGPGESFGDALAGANGFAVAGVGLLVAALAVQAWFSYQLFRQNGRLIERLQALEEKVGEGPLERPPAGLPEDSPAPQFELPDLDGRRHSLDDLLAAGRPVALAFSDPGCGACGPMVAKLAQFRAQHAGEIEIALVSSGDPAENRARINGHDFAAVLLQEEHEIADAYGAPGVPSAVVVGTDGRIASRVAMGNEAVERLLG